jgi:hypothetical protein
MFGNIFQKLERFMVIEAIYGNWGILSKCFGKWSEIYQHFKNWSDLYNLEKLHFG